MKRIKGIRCNICGKVFRKGNRADGLPNGVGFVGEDGQTFNVCTECLLDEERMQVWVEKVKKEKENS